MSRGMHGQGTRTTSRMTSASNGTTYALAQYRFLPQPQQPNRFCGPQGQHSPALWRYMPTSQRRMAGRLGWASDVNAVL